MMIFIVGLGVGFIVCGILALLILNGFRSKANDNEFTVAFYKTDNDVWEIPRNFEYIAGIIEYRRKFGKPGSIKYID